MSMLQLCVRLNQKPGEGTSSMEVAVSIAHCFEGGAYFAAWVTERSWARCSFFAPLVQLSSVSVLIAFWCVVEHSTPAAKQTETPTTFDTERFQYGLFLR